MVSIRLINTGLTLSCLIGLGLSIYAYTIELSLQRNHNYEAMCDLSQHVSCTKPFKSRYGKGFGLVGKDSLLYTPNSLFGIIFYSLTTTLAQSDSNILTKFSAIGIVLSNLASIYFAYILAFILESFCIVCVSTYVVNFLNLLLVYYKLQALNVKDKKE